jgi:hypothetical protein
MTPVIRDIVFGRRKAGEPGNEYITNCRFGADEECGMADPTKCKVHGPILAAETANTPEKQRTRAAAAVFPLFFDPGHAERQNTINRLRPIGR